MRHQFLTQQSAIGTPVQPLAAKAQGVAAGASAINGVSSPSGTDGKFITVGLSNTSGQGWTPPGGWTDSLAGTDSSLSIEVMEASGVGIGTGVPLGNFIRSATATGALVIVVRLDGAGTIQAGGASSATGDLALPSLNVTGTGILLLQIVVRIVVAGVTWTPPVGTTPLIDGTSLGTAYEYAVGYEYVNAGATGTRLWDQSGIGGATRGVILAINPVV